ISVVRPSGSLMTSTPPELLVADISKPPGSGALTNDAQGSLQVLEATDPCNEQAHHWPPSLPTPLNILSSVPTSWIWLRCRRSMPGCDHHEARGFFVGRCASTCPSRKTMLADPACRKWTVGNWVEGGSRR